MINGTNHTDLDALLSKDDFQKLLKIAARKYKKMHRKELAEKRERKFINFFKIIGLGLLFYILIGLDYSYIAKILKEINIFYILLYFLILNIYLVS